MLKLTYNRKRDEFQTVAVLGDYEGIRDLYWQLTKNYECRDGTCIGDIRVANLDGEDVTETVMTRPWQSDTRLSSFSA